MSPPNTQIRFVLSDRHDSGDHKGLTSRLSQIHGVTVPDEAVRPVGEPLADAVVIALIVGGAKVVAAAITAFGRYLSDKKKQQARHDHSQPMVVIVNGTNGSKEIAIPCTAQQVNDIDVGVITEIVGTREG